MSSSIVEVLILDSRVWQGCHTFPITTGCRVWGIKTFAYFWSVKSRVQPIQSHLSFLKKRKGCGKLNINKYQTLKNKVIMLI